MLHGLEFDIRLRVAARALAELTEPVVLIQVELGALQVLIDVLSKHLFEVALVGVALALLGSQFALPHVVQVAVALSGPRRLLLLNVKVRSARVVLRSSVVGSIHELVALDAGWS